MARISNKKGVPVNNQNRPDQAQNLGYQWLPRFMYNAGNANSTTGKGNKTMGKFFSFVAGLMSGALVGASAVLLLTPTSGEQLRADARARWEQVMQEAQQAKDATRREKELQFERMKASGKF
jgi:hypothetical protein